MSGPGTLEHRFASLLVELSKRFPNAHHFNSSSPPEPAYLAAIDELRNDNDETQALFDTMWEADMRAIKLWQAANPGQDHVWPDRSKLTQWLLDRITELQRKDAP